MRFDVDCGRIVDVVLKPVNSHSGPKLVVNELVATELAFRLGLPSLEPLLVDVPASLGPIPLRLTNGYLGTPNFAVPYISHSICPPAIEHIRAADNLGDLLGVLVFDIWTANRDRTTPGNFIASPSLPDGRQHIWMIDHGHAMTGPDWTAESLRTSALELYPYLDVLEPAIQAMDGHLGRWAHTVARVSEQELRDVVELVPASWLPDPREREALVTFLTRRRDRIVDVLANADLVSMPSWDV